MLHPPSPLDLPSRSIELVTEVVDRYYPTDSRARKILLDHSTSVAIRALSILDRHPEWDIDRSFVYEGAMLHDIGIIACQAPEIDCHGTEPYLRHGIIGGEWLRRDFHLERHARICERHTGVGLTLASILKRNLPLPHRDFVPITLEEQIVCYADLFYSKSGSREEKSPDRIRASLSKRGEDEVQKFEAWSILFE